MKQTGVFDIELATGAIIGKADLVNCVRIDEAIHSLIREQHIEEDAFGNFVPGRYAWVMENPVLFEKPIPAKGYQGIWNWEPVFEKHANMGKTEDLLNEMAKYDEVFREV